MNQTMYSHQTFSSKVMKDVLESRCDFQTQNEVKVFTKAELSVILGTVSAFFLKWRTEHKDYNARKEISKVVTCENASGILGESFGAWLGVMLRWEPGTWWAQPLNSLAFSRLH